MYTATMILLAHVIIAIASLAIATYAYLFPTLSKVHISYGFIAATLLSGTLLVFAQPGYMLHACASGLVYISLATVATRATQHKLIQT